MWIKGHDMFPNQNSWEETKHEKSNTVKEFKQCTCKCSWLTISKNCHTSDNRQIKMNNHQNMKYQIVNILTEPDEGNW